MKTACAPPASPSCRARSICSLAGAELDAARRAGHAAGVPRAALSLPGSGLYASIVNVGAPRQTGSQPSSGGHPDRRFCATSRSGNGAWRSRQRRGSRLPGDRLRRQLDGQRAGRAAGAVGARGQRRSSIARSVSSSAPRGPGSAVLRRCCLRVADAAARAGAWRRCERVAQRDPRHRARRRKPKSSVATRAEITALTSNLNTLIKQERAAPDAATAKR